MSKTEISKKIKKILQKHGWYCVLLIGSTIYTFIYRADIYQLTELNTHNLVFILWLVLLGLPLFSSIEIGNIRIQKEVEQTRAEVKESIGELRLQILDLKIANSNYNTLVVNNQPLPSKDELSQLQNNIPSNNSQTHSETTNFNISDNNIYLFKVRFSLENQLSSLCSTYQYTGRKSMYSMTQFLVRQEIIDMSTANLIREIINIANRGVHGEIIDDDYIQFVNNAYPTIEHILNTANNFCNKK